MLEVTAVREIILNELEALKPEVTPLTSSALGQVLAQDILADLDSPPFAKAMMDGYAVRAADNPTPDSRWKIQEEVPAGSMPDTPLALGHAARIFTGAPIPPGADSVVKQEDCVAEGAELVRIRPTVKPGQNVLPAGAEYRQGEAVVPRGSIITPQAFGLFAAVGKTAVSAIPLPRVSVLVTGNELVEANMKPMGPQIRNSNGPMLIAQAVRAGSLPRYLGIARDEPAMLTSLIREGLGTSQVLIVCGGVSVGDYDLVPQVLQEQGVDIQVRSVRMKPGKPFLFGRKGSVLVFGVPGNPLSGFICFELLIRPALARLAGRSLSETVTELQLAKPFQTSNDRPTYFPARRDGTAVQPMPWLGSANLRSLLAADCLVQVPAGEVSYAAGEPLPVRMI